MVRTEPLKFLTILLLVLVLGGCVGRRPPNDDIPPAPSPAIFPSLPSGPNLQILVIGDWGTGGEGQREVALAMEATHRTSPPHLVLTVGDNFYDEGVSGPRDPLWKRSFENVYRGDFWDDLIFYPTLGNHDHMGSPVAQLQYSRISPRWEMPGTHYAFRREVPGGDSVLFLALDTDPVSLKPKAARPQLEWADSLLDASTDGWIVAVGHHPVQTGGWHGVNSRVRKALLPLLRERAHLYLSGHNHSTELIETEGGLLQAVCGGGGGLDNPYQVKEKTGTLAAFTNGGWCFLKIWPEALAVELYDRSGGLQYRHLVPGTR